MQSHPSRPAILRAAFFLHKLEAGRFGASCPEHVITPNTSRGFASRKLSLDIFGEAFHYISAPIVHAITPLARVCSCTMPCVPARRFTGGRHSEALYMSYMPQTRRNQSRFWQWHAANSCKFSTLQKKKKTGRRACPTKGLEKTRNLSLSFEGLPLLKGSGPIIQNQKVRLPAPGKNGTFKRWAALFQGTVQSTSSLGNLQDDVSWLNPWT